MPSTGPIHINQPLTNLSVQYTNAEYIADQVFPAVPVSKDSDSFYVHTAQRTVAESRRANGAVAAEVSYAMSSASYSIVDHSLRHLVTDKDVRNVDTPLSAMEEGTYAVTDQILLGKELEAATILFTTTSWGNNTTLASATAWQTSTAYPIHNVASATMILLQASGRMPNTVVLGQKAYLNGKENTNVISRIQYVERAIITEDILAACFDVDKVLVGRAIYDTQYEGLSTNVQFIWDDSCWIGFVQPTPSRKSASAVYRFQAGGRTTKRYRDEERAGDWIEVSDNYLLRAVATLSAYLIKTVADNA